MVIVAYINVIQWNVITNKKGFVSMAKIFTSGDIELNPGPVDSRVSLESRLAQQVLWIFDVGGVGDCF